MSVVGAVKNATTCQLRLLSTQGFPVVYSHNPRACTNGVFTAQVTVGPNKSEAQRTIAFELVASNSTSTSTGRFFVLMAGVKPASVGSVSVTPSALSAAGGTSVIDATVKNATTCQLNLLSKQSFAVVYSHAPRSCSSGTFVAKVTIGPNPSAVKRTVAFSLVASNDVSRSDDPFYVSLAAASTPAPPKPTTPNTNLPKTTSQPIVLPTSPTEDEQSSNWSGYSAGGGPFTVAKGTFTVPTLAADTPPFDQVSEWVGIDGTNSNDTSLIQAGVDELPNPGSPGSVDIQPWWEILPAAETDINSVAVKAGDSITVTLWQVSSGTWEINLTDNTSKSSYTTPPEHYTGPLSSAEWIVEATTRCTNSCRTSGLAPFSPPVVFTNLGMTGHQTSLEQDTLVQEGSNVGTPSALTASGFNVAYTGQPDLFGRPEENAPPSG